MSNSTSGPGPKAVFTQGSTMRHVVVMTLTAAIGMIAVFFVDAISLFYISQLNDAAQTAAVGRASYILGFVIAISVGLMIGSSVWVARSLGAKKPDDARSYAGSALVFAFVFNSVVAGLLYLAHDWLLALLDAEGEALAYAKTYLTIILPATPFLGVGMVSMGVLRAVGDARRSMYVTLFGGILTALFDPIFIFVLGWEVVGAAVVSASARVLFAGLGLYFLFNIHDVLAWNGIARFWQDVRNLLKLSLPAATTNLAAPVGAFLIAEKIAEYGDAAIAGQAVVDRLIPLAFGVVFALSGAVGPIVGQNFGAGQMVRVRQALLDALIFNAVYVTIIYLVLFSVRNTIISIYAATGDMALMIDLFCTIVAASFLFNGMIFVTNAAFNNLGKPLWATGFNWGRQTIGVLPFIWIGAAWGGLPGIAYGVLIGSVPFAIFSIATAFWLIRSEARKAELVGSQEPEPA